jgi:hypothetical protein
MGRHKKPTQALATSGAFDKNPQRAAGRGDDLKTVGDLGSPPQALSLEECGEWARIVSFYPSGTLKSGHWYAVLTLAQLGAKTIAGNMLPADRAQFKNFLSEMGLTLKSAANVQLPKSKAENEFANI